jgi:hypothetical protein
MTEEDEKALAEAIADELEDSAYGTATEIDRGRTARLVVDRIEHLLYEQGWMPPRTYENVQGWAIRAANIPEHHVNRGVLTSHLTELAAILHDR